MATRRTEGGASAPPVFEPSDFTLKEAGVVRLPTAAPRKVEQTWNRRTRQGRKALPQFTGEHISQQRRNALKDAKILLEMDSASAAICLALAIFDSMAPAAKARIRSKIIERGRGRDFGPLAVLLEPRNFGQQWDLQWALERVAGEA